MKTLFAIILLTLATAAYAGVWKWVDAKGDTHFVDTNRPIYTWTDESGRVFYADTPGHEDAISVQLVWVSDGELDDQLQSDSVADSGYAFPGESAEERAEREAAEAYYCKRATEIYESYVDAPQLYRTSENGKRVYLSEEEAVATIAETKSKMDEVCH